MIKSKKDVMELLENTTVIAYAGEDKDTNVYVRGAEDISIIENEEKVITIKMLNYEDGVSALYKNRKHINQSVFKG